METALYQMSYSHDLQISLVNGNSKLGKGIWCFNTLPGDRPLVNSTRGLLTNISGTCGGCCEACIHKCYAVRDAKLHFNTCIPAWSRNTLIARHNVDGMFKQLKEGLIKNKAKVLRFHSAGEIINYNYLLHMVKLAVELPKIQFYCYTKRFDLIDRYLKEFKNFPKNFVVNISVWHNNIKDYDFSGLNWFVYDDGSDPKVRKMRHCPAVDKYGHKTGVTCGQCGWCFKGNLRRRTAVYDH